MSLKLEHVTRIVDGQVHIDDACLSFEPGSFNVLLGRTLAGKTSLMRVSCAGARAASVIDDLFLLVRDLRRDRSSFVQACSKSTNELFSCSHSTVQKCSVEYPRANELE